jgi:hypothetical protein
MLQHPRAQLKVVLQYHPLLDRLRYRNDDFRQVLGQFD